MNEKTKPANCREVQILLPSYHANELPPETAEAVESHLAGCLRCVAALEDIALPLAAIAEMKQSAQPSDLCLQRLKQQARAGAEVAEKKQHARDAMPAPDGNAIVFIRRLAAVAVIVLFVCAAAIFISRTRDKTAPPALAQAPAMQERAKTSTRPASQTLAKSQPEELAPAPATTAIAPPENKTKPVGRKTNTARIFRKHSTLRQVARAARAPEKHVAASMPQHTADAISAQLTQIKQDMDKKFAASPAQPTVSAGWTRIDSGLDTISEELSDLEEKVVKR